MIQKGSEKMEILDKLRGIIGSNPSTTYGGPPPFRQGRLDMEVIDKKAVQKAAEILRKYKDGKRNLERRIIEEEQWWKLLHWEIVGKGKNRKSEPDPVSAWMFNSITAKHADFMDNYPEPNILPREKEDEASAKTLSSIIPVIYERNNYEQTYSDAVWYKVKHGVVAKGVFWNNELEDGLGDVDTKLIDILNIFWEPGITNIQSSRNLFIVSLKDNDLLELEYPQLKGKSGGNIIDVEKYVYDDTVDVSDKSVVVDWYYKKRNSNGKVILHFCKFVGDTILYASENIPEYAENGYYNHGLYPVEFDVLFPEEDTPIGFGYVAVMKSPQLYIDKLQSVILKNAVQATKPRFFVKKERGINLDDYRDLDKDFVEVAGSIDDENLKQIRVDQVGGNVLNVLQMKIDELKETSSNRDFSQGSTASGVTSGAAISALQEAGNKQSRDMIKASYRSYRREVYLVIELMRQFYDETRSFRITGKTGYEFITFSKNDIQDRPIPLTYKGQDKEPGFIQLYKKPIFDIVVKPQKSSPYSKMAQNELAKEMYHMGIFNPKLAQQAMTALELMDFDGIEKVKEMVQQGQTLINQLQQMAQENMMLKAQLGMVINDTSSTASGPPFSFKREGFGVQRSLKRKQSDMAGQTDYGMTLAQRAKPDISQ